MDSYRSPSKNANAIFFGKSAFDGMIIAHSLRIVKSRKRGRFRGPGRAVPCRGIRAGVVSFCSVYASGSRRPRLPSFRR